MSGALYPEKVLSRLKPPACSFPAKAATTVCLHDSHYRLPPTDALPDSILPILHL
ncbi:hypothetical protein VIGAN_03225800 [Vigna angularis var. angularis]|uniref:Uncharacterized protein n=1 Tax=Vigna angularis var. angularis TaxID=157739 RepID=A0A0S3RNV5_PHAAN|nr:hypothetical protein VIGAN_03225800 [Vigna angularis var. angularis]